MTSVPTFATRPSFLGIERSDPVAAICVAGIPYDLGTSNRPGARFGPAAIRQASRMLVDGDHPLARSAPAAGDIADIGDLGIAHGDIAGSLAAIEAQARPLNHLVALGGDHTVTLGLLRALAARTGPLALVHFDAHVDTWPESFGQRYGHGSPFYHAIEMHQRQRPVARRQRAQQPEGHGMVAAERNDVVERPRLRLDRRQRAGDVAVGEAKIADIGDVAVGRLRPGDRLVAVNQHAARLADRGRAKARARPVRGAEVMGNAGDADRRPGIAAFDPEKARPGRISRDDSHALNI
jgi:arginase family enzyme